MTEQPPQQLPKASKTVTLSVFALAATVLWVYWFSFVEMAALWSRRPEYSHGWIVPLFGIFLLSQRREFLAAGDAHQARLSTWILAGGVLLWLGPWLFEYSGGIVPVIQGIGVIASIAGFAGLISAWLAGRELKPAWWGLALLLVAVAVRLYAASVYVEWIDFVSLIPFVAGLVWLTAGTWILRWSWVAIAFLFFMIPLPFRLEVALRDPLRRAGTVASTYVMQTIGLPAFAEGNVVTVNEVGINVVEACSGLRMMMVFFALSVGLAIVLNRPIWQRLLIAVSAIPIALIANITRITLTGLLYVWGYDELAEDFFHDFAGWMMPIIGVLLLRLEIWYLDHLFTGDDDAPLTMGIGAPRRSEATAG